jgi:hypothetical protein
MGAQGADAQSGLASKEGTEVVVVPEVVDSIDELDVGGKTELLREEEVVVTGSVDVDIVVEILVAILGRTKIRVEARISPRTTTATMTLVLEMPRLGITSSPCLSHEHTGCGSCSAAQLVPKRLFVPSAKETRAA